MLLDSKVELAISESKSQRTESDILLETDDTVLLLLVQLSEENPETQSETFLQQRLN